MELTQCINYLLTTAQHTVFQKLSSRLEEYNVTPVQYGVLHCLWREGTAKPKEIANELKIENSTISGVLERMEKKELIRREISTDDRRFIEVTLTEMGKSLETPILNIVEQVNHDILAGFSEEECLLLKTFLKSIAEAK